MPNSSKLIDFPTPSPLSENLQLIHTAKSCEWFDRVKWISDLTELPIQTVMESWEEICNYCQNFNWE